MHRKLCRFWLNYRCPGKRSIPSVAPMLMVLQQGRCVSVGVTHTQGTNPEAPGDTSPALDGRGRTNCWLRASSSLLGGRGRICL